MADRPLLSVVVCTHERPEELARCLDGLARLQDPVEVIVVDSASRTHNCRGLVESFAGRIPRLRYCYEDVPGLSRARNRGLAEAVTDLVAFVDDDARPHPDWAARLAAPFADPAVGCVGGACHPDFRAARPPWLSDRLLQYAGVTRFGTVARETRSSAEYPYGANVAFRRQVLIKRGGFDEALGRTGSSLLSGEEWAAIEGLIEDGWRIRLEPSAVVDHSVGPDRCNAGYYWRRLWWQGVSRARGEGSTGTTLRLLAALPARALAWVATGDRFFLYRLAETPGYLVELARRRR